jgi:exodeoxyribonuclease V alpha subunit
MFKEYSMTRPVYSHFNQVKESIYGVEAIDYFFAKEMISALAGEIEQSQGVEAPEKYSNLFHLFLALHASLRAGHSCLPLPEVADQHWGKGFVIYTEKAVEVTTEDEIDLSINLSHAGFIFCPLAQLKMMLTELNITEADNQLLVLNDDNLYLRRYFTFESDLGLAINIRLAQQCLYDDSHIEQCITALFPTGVTQISDSSTDINTAEIDWQKVAVANAINKNFSVIAGGPGTGKTYTVTKLLAALVMLHQVNTKDEASLSRSSNKSGNMSPSKSLSGTLKIALVAPTGKAAQRLSESIVDAISGFKDLIDVNVLAEIPTQAQTIHRLLGVLHNSPNFKHHEDNQLNYDIVLIDEVSMVDLPLMNRIFRALKPNAKVILLGDADQLPSVAAGSVLADIAPRPHSGFSDKNNSYLSQVCQLSIEQLIEAFPYKDANRDVDGDSVENGHYDYLTFLVKSRRFDGHGGIGLLANSVIKGDSTNSWRLLCQSQSNQNQLSEVEDKQLSMAQGELTQWLAPLVKQYYQPIEYCTDVKKAFALLAQFRVLCATRQGEYGVEQVNELIKSYLGKNIAPYQQRQQPLYHGQPIMINENDYRLGLYNGDIGIIWRVIDQEGKTHLMACFEDSSEKKDNTDEQGDEKVPASLQGIRQILPSRLPSFESVYAMTIHKTQGSEFAHVAMVISSTQSTQAGKQGSASKLLSRELLYTGITRAKKQLTIAANQSVWQQGVRAQVQRHSGLRLCSTPEK